jgi:hypothetical protein
MRRLGYFWSGLPLFSKLQYLLLGLVMGTLFVRRDLHPGNQFLGLPLWQITVPLIVATFILGRLLLPVMLLHPVRTQRVLYLFGISLFAAGLYFATRRLVMITHLGTTCALWLDVSCWFWFISEIQLRAAAMRNRKPGTVARSAGSEFDDEEGVGEDGEDGKEEGLGR